jgi:hypothetical protein
MIIYYHVAVVLVWLNRVVKQAAAAAVNTSSRRSGRNTIAVSDAAASTTSCAPNPGGSINATSSGHSQPTATDLLCDEMEEEEQTHAY